MRYVSIDIETLGLNSETCDVIEFGAVIETGGKLKDLPTYHCYLTPPNDSGVYHGEPYAMAMHSEILRRIANREQGYSYVPPAFLSVNFASWLESEGYTWYHGVNDKIKIVVAGKNFAAFDWQFLKRIAFESYIEIFHRVIDPAMMYFDATKDETPPGLDECFKRAGLNKLVKHTAVEDALDVIRCLRHKWNIDLT